MKKLALSFIFTLSLFVSFGQKAFYVDIGMDVLDSKDLPVLQYGFAVLPRYNFLKFDKTSISLGVQLAGFIYSDSLTKEKSINYRATPQLEYSYGFASGGKDTEDMSFGFSVGGGFGVFLIGTDRYGATIGQGLEGTFALKFEFLGDLVLRGHYLKNTIEGYGDLVGISICRTF